MYTKEERKKIRARLKELAAEKISYRDMAAALNKEGFKSPGGNALTELHVSCQLWGMRRKGTYVPRMRRKSRKSKEQGVTPMGGLSVRAQATPKKTSLIEDILTSNLADRAKVDILSRLTNL